MGQEKNKQNQKSVQSPEEPNAGKDLMQKRLSLKLSQNTLAKFLGVSTNTVRNWENAPEISCRKTLRQLQDNFIQGVYDKELKLLGATGEPPRLSQENQRELREIIDKVACTYTVCEGAPHLQEKFIEKINSVLDKILEKHNLQQ